MFQGLSLDVRGRGWDLGPCRSAYMHADKYLPERQNYKETNNTWMHIHLGSLRRARYKGSFQRLQVTSAPGTTKGLARPPRLRLLPHPLPCPALAPGKEPAHPSSRREQRHLVPVFHPSRCSPSPRNALPGFVWPPQFLLTKEPRAQRLQPFTSACLP